MKEGIFCHAFGYTLADANHIIAVLAFIVILLIAMVYFIMRHNRIVSQRNEQLRRILTALDSYRTLVANGTLPLDELEKILNTNAPTSHSSCYIAEKCVVVQRLMVILAVTLLSSHVSAQTGVRGLFRKVSTMIDSISITGLDRRYIDAPEKPWQIIVKGNVNQSIMSMKASGSMAGFDYDANPYLKTEPSRYAGVWAGYRGYGLGYTANVGGDKGSYLTFGATGGAYGLNVRIHSFKNSSPNFNLNSNLIPEDSKEEWKDVQLIDPIKVHSLIADGYYLFNGKHFSYAAAYDQSVLQKRSAGSIMAGAMYYYSSIDYASPSNGDLIYMMQGLGKAKLWQGSAGMGYAYNWVPANGLLVSVMAMPMLTFVNKIKVYGYATNVEELMECPEFWDESMDSDLWDQWFYGNLRIKPMGEKTFNSGMTVNFDARLSLTYNFGCFFINAYGQFNNMRYRHDTSHGYLNDWFINTSVGLRL